MPNWCANSLKLTANSEEKRQQLQQIVMLAEKDGFNLFGFFYPCPPELLDTAKSFPVDPKAESNLEKYGYETWYEFNIDKYGCKWDASNVCIVESDKDYIILNFDTPWSPPENFYNNLLDDDWGVEATYVEGGVNYIGYYRNGDSESENFNDGSIDYDSDECYEQETTRMESYFYSVGIDHYPAHTGG